MLPVAAGVASAEETAYVLAAETLSAAHDLTPAPVTHTERRRAVEVAQLIGERASESLSLEALAAHAGTSPFHILRSFKRAIGVTPHQYLLYRRLEHAALGLLDGDRPVIDVAFAAGFSDLANFNRSFRHAFGCSPRQLRRNFRKVPALAAWGHVRSRHCSSCITTRSPTSRRRSSDCSRSRMCPGARSSSRC